MVISIYDTAVLVQTIDLLPKPKADLLARYYPNVATSTAKTVAIDTVTGGRLRAAYCLPHVPAPLVRDGGVRTLLVEPAYTKDLRDIKPGAALVRSAGEAVGGNKTAADRLKALTRQTLQQGIGAQTRTREVQASEGLRFGAVTIEGENYPKTAVSFGRDARLAQTVLTGADLWTDPASDPLGQLKARQLLVMEVGGTGASDVIMGVRAFAAFSAHPKVIDKFKYTSGGAQNTLAPNGPTEEGLQFMGAIDGLNIFVYVGWYATPEAPTVNLEIWPADEVAVGSQTLDGVQSFGAIEDIEAIEAGTATGPTEGMYYAKSWVEKDPSVRKILIQSAPLMIPTRVNSWSSLVVLARAEPEG